MWWWCAAQVREIEAIQEKEKQELLDAQRKQSAGPERSKGVKSNWSAEETALLIKAVNLFPAGTVQRYERASSPPCASRCLVALGVVVRLVVYWFIVFKTK